MNGSSSTSIIGSVINEFNMIRKNNLRAKYQETINNKDRYIVRLDGYKALVEVDEEKIDLILEL